jgi:hypothetical protein
MTGLSGRVSAGPCLRLYRWFQWVGYPDMFQLVTMCVRTVGSSGLAILTCFSWSLYGLTGVIVTSSAICLELFECSRMICRPYLQQLIIIVIIIIIIIITIIIIIILAITFMQSI